MCTCHEMDNFFLTTLINLWERALDFRDVDLRLNKSFFFFVLSIY